MIDYLQSLELSIIDISSRTKDSSSNGSSGGFEQ
jgi:hypothetical protein